MATNNLMSRLGLDASGFTNGMNKVKGEFNSINKGMQKQFGKSSKQITGSLTGLAASFKSFPVLAGLVGSVGGALSLQRVVKDAVSTESALSQVNRMLGNSAQEFRDWAKISSASFGMSTSEAIKFGAIYSNLVSTFTSDTEDAKNKTIELLKASAVISSGTGREMSDVMERIRSGMLGNTEAIEDLGINVYTSAIQQTDAFKMMAGGAKNWDSIQSFSLKQQIRYFAILEQANKRYGNSLRDNVATKIQIFTVQLKNIGTNIGSSFLPILDKVLPKLAEFLSKIVQITEKIAQFSYALFGSKKAVKKQTSQIDEQKKSVDDLGDSYKNATNALAPFDKINTLSSSSSGSDNGDGGNDGGGLPSDIGNGDSVLYEISDKIKKAAQDVKSALSGMFNNPTFQKYWKLFSSAITEIWNVVSKFGTDMLAFFQSGNGKQFMKAIENIFSFLYPIIKFFVEIIVSDLKILFDGIKNVIQGAIKIFSAIFTGDWKKLWEGLVQLFKGIVEVLWIAIQYVFGAKIFGIVGKFFKGFGKLFTDSFKIVFDAIKTFFNSIGKSFLEFFGTLFNFTKYNPIGAIKTLFLNLKGEFLRVFTTIKDDIVKLLMDIVGKDNLIKIVAKFSEVGSKIVEAIKNPFNTIADFFKGIVNNMIGMVNTIIRGLNKLNVKLPDWAGGKSFGVNIPEIPKLATGGVVSSPTLAMVGESGSEAIMPLENNTGWIDKLASKLNGGSGGEIVINIGGTQLARITASEMNRLNRQAGRTILTV